MAEIEISCLTCGWTPEDAQDENEELELITLHSDQEHQGLPPSFELKFTNPDEMLDFEQMLELVSTIVGPVECDVCTCPPGDCHDCPCSPGEPTA